MFSVAVIFPRRKDGAMASKEGARVLDGCASTGDPLADIVAGCRRREPRAQQELVARTQDKIYRLLVRLVGVQEAEDVAQQVYLQVFRQLERFNGQSQFATWLYRVAVNEAMQHLRRKRRRRWSVLNWEPEVSEPDRHRQTENRELLDQALAGIEPELRAVFVLREVEGLSYEAIGVAVGIPMGTVASRLNRARHELQERLRSLGWSG